MTYCTTSDVRVVNPKRTYHTTSAPTLVQVTSMIVYITADMNVRIQSLGISVPIATSPVTDASKFLKYVCAIGSAALAEESTFAGGNKQESTHAELLWKRYESAFMRIEANPHMLTPGDSGAVMSSYEFDEPDAARITEPFTTTRDTW